MWKSPLATFVAAGCGVVLLAGCSGSSKTGTADGPTSSATTGTAGASTATSSSSAVSPNNGTSSSGSGSTAPAATAAQLEKIVLQPKDLPAGWKDAPYKADAGADSADSADAAMTKCVGGRDTDQDKVADANSDDYSLGDNSISSSATSYRSQSAIDADIAVLHNHKLEACMVQLAKKEIASSLPAGAKVESASMKITPGAAGGPSNVVATGVGNVKVSVNNQQVTVYLNQVFITGPLIEADLDTETLGAPLPAPILKSLVAAVAGRAAKG